MGEHLKRRVGVGLLTAYGVGVMVGAGIYVLVGAVAGEAGIWAPLAFLLAGLIAAPTALSYSELSSRIPEAAGEAAYVQRAFNSQALAAVIGLAIVAAGTVSAAAVLRGGVGYLMVVLDAPEIMLIIMIGIALTAIALYGVVESLAFAAVFTVIELGGLALVVWAGLQAPAVADWQSPPDLVWAGVGAGAVLAFFAFIGFEDIVNMAEEVEAPERNIPRAILISLVITTVLYAVVTLVTVRALPVSALADSEKPLALVWQAGKGGDAKFLSTIAVFAALNGVMAQIVMASRVLFGLGRRNGLLKIFHHAHPKRGTPVFATVLIGSAVILAALILDVSQLAEMSASILLAAFVLVNLSLIVLKGREPDAPFSVPMVVPVSGFLLSVAALVFNLGVAF